ncbi:hypothetical protein COJ60_29180 [Bacillus cereus]|uniref:DUF4183 domain-containing protein n=1 Tax=Bacillus cereus group TaxID=86661 RepID=UPI000BFA9C58|nr:MULTISPECIES: DUF4183 domain-containing protein [Bacillus cereus group]NMW17007.1 DUF4183 domain-containing protein [Bacillus paranthracis]PEV03808.1 hypothetical protein CN407_24445 [Bacillus cereus]PFN29866.1 hypothetical protein COJ60_29180 [Bacillus cereus]PGM66021.1 hypothetical protein CN950_14695 [Bacillus cereus]RAT14385.1 hypothetical protein A6E22_00385 [Bacillus cereus]
MALQLMKLAISASTVTNIDPEASRFFYVTAALTAGGDTLTIDAADFFQDDGTAVTTLPTLSPDNHYFNVFINGVLQMESISTYTPGATGVGSLAISVPAGSEDVLVGTPIVLELVQYTPDSTTTVSA